MKNVDKLIKLKDFIENHNLELEYKYYDILGSNYIIYSELPHHE